MNEEVSLSFLEMAPECFAVPSVAIAEKNDCANCAYKKRCVESVAELLQDHIQRKINKLRDEDQKAEREVLYDKYVRLDVKIKWPSFSPDVLRELKRRVKAYIEKYDHRPVGRKSKEIASLPLATVTAPLRAVSTHKGTKGTTVSVPIITVTPPVATGILPLPPTGGSTPVAAATGTYKFPIPVGRPFVGWSNTELIADLERLKSLGITPSHTVDYAVERERICAVHIELNIRQQCAPRFRPMHSLPWKAESVYEENACCDRQVIDIHWRAHSNNKPRVPAHNYSSIFESNPFDVAIAERFSKCVWKPAARVVHLHLSEEMEWEHAYIQSMEVRKKWLVIERGDARGAKIKQYGAPQIEVRLRNSIGRKLTPAVIDTIEGFVNAWKARMIVGDSLVGIARMIALMTGEKQRDPRAVQRTLEALDAHLKKKP